MKVQSIAFGNEAKTIAAKHMPVNSVARVVKWPDLIVMKSKATQEVVRVWSSGGFESLSLDAVENWEVEVLPPGTTVTFTF